MKAGDIVLAIIPQDLLGKRRPVLLLKQMPTKYNDFLVSAISTQLHQYIHEFDLIIRNTDKDFAETGLLTTSVVRLASLAILTATSITGTIGFLKARDHQQLLKNLANHLLDK